MASKRENEETEENGGKVFMYGGDEMETVSNEKKGLSRYIPEQMRRCNGGTWGGLLWPASILSVMFWE